MKHTVKIAAFVVAAIAVVGLTGCDEKPAEVSKSKDSSASVVKEKPGSKSKVEDAADTPESDEVAEGTAQLGDTVEVGDWSVKVTEIALNANDAVHKANMFNDKPRGQYVLVTYDATYNGAERTADTMSDLSWSFTGSDNKISDQAYEVTPADNQEWPSEARKGGTVTQQVLFDVNPKVLTGSILSVEGYTADFDEVFADFAVS